MKFNQSKLNQLFDENKISYRPFYTDIVYSLSSAFLFQTVSLGLDLPWWKKRTYHNTIQTINSLPPCFVSFPHSCYPLSASSSSSGCPGSSAHSSIVPSLLESSDRQRHLQDQSSIDGQFHAQLCRRFPVHVTTFESRIFISPLFRANSRLANVIGRHISHLESKVIQEKPILIKWAMAIPSSL